MMMMQEVEQCIALVDYDALCEDEISFCAHDVICVIAKGTDSGFWKGYVASGERRGSHGTSKATWDHTTKPRAGFFPCCFVTSNMRFSSMKPIFCDKALCLYDYTPSSGSTEEMAFCRGDVLTVVRPSRLPGWWYGVNESATRALMEGASKRHAEARAVSATTVAKANPSATLLTKNEVELLACTCGSRDVPLLFPSTYVTCDVVQAVYSFQPRQTRELGFRVGDVIQVHRRWNDGWWEGSMAGEARRGIFPSNYTVPNVATTEVPFFCQACKSVYVVSKALLRECEKCTCGERITEKMLETLEEYCQHLEGKKVAAEQATAVVPAALNLFEKVPLEPGGLTASGGAAPGVSVLTEEDVADVACGRVKF